MIVPAIFRSLVFSATIATTCCEMFCPLDNSRQCFAMFRPLNNSKQCLAKPTLLLTLAPLPLANRTLAPTYYLELTRGERRGRPREGEVREREGREEREGEGQGEER